MGDSAAVVIKPALQELFLTSWEQCRILFFAAPCGCGKTTAAEALLRGHTVARLNGDFDADKIPRGCDVVLVDDLHTLTEAADQQALCGLIRTRTDLHFVLLSRSRVPGWLIPFSLSGLMTTVDTQMLLWDLETSRRMLESRGIAVTADVMAVIQREMTGYPLVMQMLSRRMAAGAAYSETIYADCKRELFFYYDDAIYRRFDLPLRQFLLSVAPFESFRLELARMVSGDPHAGELLGTVLRDTNMLLFDGFDNYHFWPIFREFLMWELEQTLTEHEQHSLYARAALYYELQGELNLALEYYVRAGAQSQVSALLVKNAEKHPGVGYYREMQDYYFALPREEILRSPSLMCAMSMLTAMCLDYESSEQWYQELAAFASRLPRSDSQLRSIRGKLAYLDIALPQRGSKGLIDIISNVFRVLSDHELSVPSFSVTSTLPSIMNGGKDFCEWSKKDDLLYATMRRPVESVLGRDGIGLADCAICESKFEKGEDISKRMLTLMTRLGDIQARGTPDIEFAVVGLLARVQVAQGKAGAALESVLSLRQKYCDAGQTRFLANIDALICRLHLRLDDREAVRFWLREKAPQNDVRLWAMWRYQYLTRAAVQISEGEYSEPLLLLARLLPYCERCGRVMDLLLIRLLMALCHERLDDPEWKVEMNLALDTCCEYNFVWPVAQYGAAMLPLLRRCGWHKDASFWERLTAMVRTQAVQYPRLLKPQSAIAEPLSAAERQVLKLLCDNLSNQEICDILDIKLPTVKTHVSHILQKLGVKRRSEAKAAAEKLQLN